MKRHQIKSTFKEIEMFKNNLRITLRTLLKDRLFTSLNVIGLSTSLTCVILIYLWVSNERSVDKFHVKDSQLYQAICKIKLPDGIHTQEYTPGLLARSLAKEIPEIEQAISVLPAYEKGILSAGGTRFKTLPQYVDRDFFNVFSYQLLQGNKDQVLANENSVLLSDELAMKMFHTTKNIVGKTVKWADDKEPYIVSGIFEKPGANSSVQFDVLFSYDLILKERASDLQSWGNTNPYTYLILRKGTDVAALNKKIEGYILDKSSGKLPLTLSVRKYSDEYLYDKYENGVQVGGRIEYVRMFSIIAFVILLIACINFMNLSTARATRRMKEVGIKKVVGAGRLVLILQYLGESLLLTFLSLAIALVLVVLLLPQFNAITAKQLNFHFTAASLIAVIAILLLTGLIAGSYPAFFLSGFKPTSVLKGKLPLSWGETWVRKGLVVFQFTLSALFIVSVLVIYNQIKLIQTINLGYNKDNIISFRNDGQLSEHFKPFMTDLKKIPGVVNASTFNGDLTGNPSGNTENLDWEGRPPGEKIFFTALDVDYGLLEMLNIKTISGRTFSTKFASDSFAIILNQAAIDEMGLSNPLGKIIKVWGGQYHIIGIVKNFHYKSLYEKIKPCFIRCNPDGFNVLVKLNPLNQGATITQIRQLYSTYNPDLPLEYSFIDQDYQNMYVSEQRVAVLSRWFAGLAIIISCLGLFGLAAFTAQKRQKEIGIRKVIGATTANIVGLLSKDFLMLILLAMFISLPLSWWTINHWLDGFAYRVQISPLLFLVAFGTVLLTSIFAISIQSIKAAVNNPVNSLRSE
jgi:putative ABC transport system permease protein